MPGGFLIAYYNDNKITGFVSGTTGTCSIYKVLVFKHPFSLSLILFKSFLSFQAPTKISDMLTYVETLEIKKYFQQFNQDSTLSEILENDVSRKTNFSQISHGMQQNMSMQNISIINRKFPTNFTQPPQYIFNYLLCL